ncbi:MAG TPA: hypothetical protein VMI53_03225, partial [Opitutaceae bacterium]|nr:hypothetical protein [Opitutaceae bacterium]
MRDFWQKVIGLLAALAAAPLVGWGSAVILARAGVKTISVSTQPSAQIGLITFKFGPAISLNLNFQQWAFAIWSGVAIAIVFAIVVTTVAWRFSYRYRHGGFILSGAVFAAAVSGYVWLAWDEPPLPKIDPTRLVPNPGMRRPPRELFLKATRGQDNGWPTALIASWKDEPSLEWLHEHADEIRADWMQLAPVSDWVRQINSYGSFDDYCYAPEEPIVDFRALRQFDYGCRRMALLMASEGHDDQAVALLSDL